MTEDVNQLLAIINGNLEFKHRYTDLRLIGEGGMGKVYFAHDIKMGKPVAIKLLHRHVSSEQIVRFQQEARALSKLDSRYIVKVLDFQYTDEDGLFLVLEYVEGESLEGLVKNGPLPVEDAIKIAVKLCDAMEHAHFHGVIHRDLKPSNVMLDAEKNPRILDFGIAKLLTNTDDPFGTLTRAGQLLGTPLYMSPEQVRGESVDFRSDIYGLGMLVYVMVAGRAPYDSDQITEIFSKKMSGVPLPSLRLWIGETDTAHALNAVVSKAMKSDPDERYSSMTELREALQAITLEEELKQITAIGVSKKFNWRNLGFIAAVLACLCVVGLFMSTFLYATTREGEKKIAPVKTEPLPKPKKGDLPVGFSLNENARGMSEFWFADKTLVDADLKRLSGTKVKYLSVAGTKISTGLENNPSAELLGIRYLTTLPLKGLDLGVTCANDDVLKEVAKMKELERLDLAGTKISNEGLGNLIPLGARLKALSLDRCRGVTDKGLRIIVSSFPNLERLHIGDTSIDRSQLRLLTELKKLTQLSVTSLDLQDDDLKMLSKLNLSLLDVTTNGRLTDRIFEILGRWKNLSHLELIGTGVSAEGVKRFKQTHPSCSVILAPKEQMDDLTGSGLIDAPESITDDPKSSP